MRPRSVMEYIRTYYYIIKPSGLSIAYEKYHTDENDVSFPSFQMRGKVL